MLCVRAFICVCVCVCVIVHRWLSEVQSLTQCRTRTVRALAVDPDGTSLLVTRYVSPTHLPQHLVAAATSAPVNLPGVSHTEEVMLKVHSETYTHTHTYLYIYMLYTHMLKVRGSLMSAHRHTNIHAHTRTHTCCSSSHRRGNRRAKHRRSTQRGQGIYRAWGTVQVSSDVCVCVCV